MNKELINVLIVDDEPIAIMILETFLNKLPGYHMLKPCKNALEALSVINKEKVDVLLLDINLPEVNGIDFIKNLNAPPLVIFTTAYSDFAVQSYELNAIDYLLKPISFERFSMAINKVSDLLKPTKEHTATYEKDTEKQDIMFVRSSGKWIKIDLLKLWFVEGLKDYIRLWTDSGRITVHSTMMNFEEQLAPYKRFVRVHKSYIVNMDYVLEVDGNSIKIKDQLIGIGNTYRDQVQKVFESYRFI